MSARVATETCGRFTIQVRGFLVTVSGKHHGEAMAREDVVSRIKFYRKLTEKPKTGHFYAGTLKACERALELLDASFAEAGEDAS
ncbi:hypothetical protein [Shimia aestuarii]|uniref:hypothetical protein n=1 Tax=Shimia aestuarii TaxID=254406 RepID=UPI001FB2817F|nr:hypothetical protein [Shimia aestuarii]